MKILLGMEQELSKIKIKDEDITDKEKYILSYKIDTLNGINR